MGPNPTPGITKNMKKEFENKKLDWCRDELKVLLLRLVEGNYHTTAQFVFDHIAHTGVETDLDKSLKERPSFDEFMNAE